MKVSIAVTLDKDTHVTANRLGEDVIAITIFPKDDNSPLFVLFLSPQGVIDFADFLSDIAKRLQEEPPSNDTQPTTPDILPA